MKWLEHLKRNILPLVTKYVDENDYTSILRAILSWYELIWLYYSVFQNMA